MNLGSIDYSGFVDYVKSKTFDTFNNMWKFYFEFSSVKLIDSQKLVQF
jgi:hypothetical protein